MYTQEDSLSRFSQQVSAWVNEGQLPCAQLMLTADDHTVTADSFGCSDKALFRLASSTKIFLSAATLRLVDAGKLKLDQPLTSILSEHSNKITILDLLRHSCGYGYGDTEPYGENLRAQGLLSTDDFGMNSWVHNLTLRDWSSALAKVRHEDPPGTVTRYGLGHDLLGAALEVLCDSPLDDIVTSELLNPLGLSNTFFVVPEERHKDMTSFYNYEEAGLNEVEAADRSPFLERPIAFSGGGGWDMLGNGGLVSNATDITRLLQTIIEPDNGFLSPQSRALLLRSQTRELSVTDIQPGCGYSLGVACVDDKKGYQDLAPPGTLWWGGSTNTFYFYHPEKRITGAFMTNTFPFGHENAIYRFLGLSNS